MSEPSALWREARGFYQDKGRDSVPPGFVWDMQDFVPDIIGAPVRMRGAWTNQSDALPAPADGMLWAQFEDGDKLLACCGANLREISQGAAGSTAIGAIGATLQNPIMHRDRVIIPAASGAAAAKFVTLAGVVYTISAAPASALQGKLATSFKDRTVLGASDAEPQRVALSKPGDPTIAWDALSIIDFSLALTGLATQRNQILGFHAGSVERLRGTTPPDSTASDPTGDMLLDTLFDRAGCYDPRSIAYWNDNVIFADARGIHITDGAVVRNMTAQGGVVRYWRQAFYEEVARGDVVSVAGTVIRDIYICTIRSATGSPITFLCDIPTRRFYLFGNVDAASFAFSLGTGEYLYATDQATSKVTNLSPAFNPDDSILQVDGNGVDVLPYMDLGWLRIGKREGWRRIFSLFVSYETGSVADDATAALEVSYTHSPADEAYESLGTFRRAVDLKRRALPVGRRLLGIGIRIQQLIPTKDTRIYDISADMSEEEGSTL